MRNQATKESLKKRAANFRKRWQKQESNCKKHVAKLSPKMQETNCTEHWQKAKSRKQKQISNCKKQYQKTDKQSVKRRGRKQQVNCIKEKEKDKKINSYTESKTIEKSLQKASCKKHS